MRPRVRASLTVLFATAMTHAIASGQRPAPCRVVVVEAEVRAGQGFQAPVLAGVNLRLDATASGWVLRIAPPAHAAEDWAEMATPPYRSITPLAVTTDWSFRAQDAVGWNPRRFQFAPNQVAFTELRSLRQAVEGGETGKAGALAELASRQPGGVLEILDAHLVPGTADQTRAAGLVAGHFTATAHQLDQPAGDRPTPLGAVTWMRFRVSLDLPSGAKAAAGQKIERRKACGGG